MGENSTDICIIQGCYKKIHRRKLCNTHYRYLLKYRVFKKFSSGLSDAAINEIYYDYYGLLNRRGERNYEHFDS